MSTILITGGARSGKSTMAVRLAQDDPSVVFIATATAGDEDMRRRIMSHKRERAPAWITVEEPLDPIAGLAGISVESTVILDCVTLWVSNLLLGGIAEEDILLRVSEFAGALDAYTKAVIVTNEVGSGIVPDNELARRYRDALGRANIAIGERVDRIVLAVAGRMLETEML